MPANVTLLNADHLEYTTQLVVEICCNCNVPFAMPRSLQQAAREDSDIWFWCVRGHSQHYTDDLIAKYKKERDAARNRAASAEQAARRQRELREAAERSASAYKAVATKARKRIGRGVCPCCNRSFAQVERHMASKHPDYAFAEVTP